MKNLTKIILVFVTLFLGKVKAQDSFQEIKAGHQFMLSLPSYMTRTMGLNSSATYQFKNSIKDVYGFVIEDSKEELKIVEMNFTSTIEFYDDFIKDFAVDEDKRKVTKPQFKKVGNIGFVESELTYYDKEAQTDIYYLIGIVETQTTFYKVLCWCTVANKDKYKEDFQKILYSLKD